MKSRHPWQASIGLALLCSGCLPIWGDAALEVPPLEVRGLLIEQEGLPRLQRVALSLDKYIWMPDPDPQSFVVDITEDGSFEQNFPGDSRLTGVSGLVVPIPPFYLDFARETKLDAKGRSLRIAFPDSAAEYRVTVRGKHATVEGSEGLEVLRLERGKQRDLLELEIRPPGGEPEVSSPSAARERGGGGEARQEAPIQRHDGP